MPSQTDSRPSAKPAARKRCSYPSCRKLATPGRKRCDEHKPGSPQNPARRGPGRKKLTGRTEARVYTKPLRPLNRKTSRGYEVIDFAKLIGEPLLPWQEWAVIHALELNPDGSYRFRTVLILVARQNGKSHLKRIVTLWRMYMDGAREIVGAAQDVSLARKQWQMCQASIHACPDLEEEWAGARNVNGDEMFWAAGCVYAIKATNDKAGRGGSNDEVNIDELRAQKDWKAWGSLSKTTMARPRGQTWAMSNAGDDTSVVLNQLQAVGEAGTDPSLCLLEWSAPPGCELDDVSAWQQANPGLGYTVSEAAIRSAIATDPPEVFRTEVLCQRVANLDSAIDLERWEGCADAMGSLEAHKGNVAACFDVAPDGKHATLTVAAPLGDGRVRVEVTAAWKNTDEARRELPGLLARIRPQAFGWFPSGPSAGMATTLRPLALRYNKRHAKRQPGDPPEDGTITGARASEVCQELADLVKALRVVHPADPLLDAHVRGASKLHGGDGWRFTRKGEGHVDAAYAAAGAVSLALALPPVRRGRIHSFAA
jgi:Phage Terminase